MLTRSITRRRLLRNGSIIIAGVVLFAACGAPPAPTAAPAKPAEPAKPAASAPAQATPVPAAKPAGSAAKTTLTIWDNNDGWKKTPAFWQELTTEKFPGGNLDLNVVKIPYADYEAKYLAAFTAGSGAPDIFSAKVANYVGAIDVGEAFPKEMSAKFEKEVLKPISQFYKVKDQWYGYPLSADLGMMLLYNTDHYQEVGLDPTKPPATVAELREHAIKLTKKNDKGEIVRPGHTIRATSAPVGIADKWLPYLHAFGGRIYSEDSTKATGVLNGPDAIRALEYVTNLIQVDKAANPQLGTPEDQFAGAMASMIYRESWFVGAMKERGPNVKFEVTLLPKEKAYPGVSLFFSWSLMVYKKSPVKDMAFKWIDFTAIKEHDLNLAKLENYLPVLTENYKDPYVAERRDIKVINQILAAPPGPYYDHPRINQIADRVGRAVEESTLGKKKPAEALDAAASDIDKIMARG
jgi:ABC-type glycerol-3-phosphate transport system substrate-binding protein